MITAQEERICYPKHRSGMKTHKIETTPVPVLPQDTPITGNWRCWFREAFGIHSGTIAAQMPASMVLVHGRLDQNITDTTRIRQLRIHGKPFLKEEIT